jgi:hypothetical protein
VFAYDRGFWNDRGTWVAVSVVVGLLALWCAAVVVNATWDVLSEERKKGVSKRDVATAVGSVVIFLALPVLLLVASVGKAVFENQRFERHKTNERIAAEIAVDLSDDGAVGSKSKATVLYCLYEALDDWAVFRDGDREDISRFLEEKRSECVASAPEQSDIDKFMTPGTSDGDLPRGGDDCDIVCVPSPSEDDFVPEPSGDPCDGYNTCIEGPDGRYGEDWINDPWDEPNDGR